MGNDHFRQLVRLVENGQIDRRRLVQSAAALGFSAGAANLALMQSGAAAAQEGEPNLLTVSTEQPPTWIRVFNPLLAQDASRWPTQAGIYEPMIIHNTITGETLPWLASEYSYSDDNLQLTFTLRDGVLWSDGEALTAEDVKFTFDYLTEHAALPGTEGVRGAIPFIESVEATDELTVVFTFTQVFSPGLFDVGEQMIVPQHIWSEIEDPVTFTNENPVGTGPFTEIGTFEDQYYEVLKNPNYWQEGLPYIDGFRFPVLATNDAANLAMVNGEIDLASHFVPDIETVYIGRDPEHFNYWFPAIGATVQLYANTTRAPFDDVNVRKAFAMSIDKATILTAVERDLYTNMDGIFHPEMDVYESGEPVLAFDPDAARAALEASSYGSADALPNIAFWVTGTEATGTEATRAAAMQEMWRQNLGVNVEIRVVPTYEEMLESDVQLVIGSEGIQYPDGSTAVGYLLCDSPANIAQFCDEDFDALVAEAGMTQDEALAIDLYRQAQAIALDSAALLPLWRRANHYLVKPHVQNFVTTAMYTMPSLADTLYISEA